MPSIGRQTVNSFLLILTGKGLSTRMTLMITRSAHPCIDMNNLSPKYRRSASPRACLPGAAAAQGCAECSHGSREEDPGKAAPKQATADDVDRTRPRRRERVDAIGAPATGLGAGNPQPASSPRRHSSGHSVPTAHLILPSLPCHACHATGRI